MIQDAIDRRTKLPDSIATKLQLAFYRSFADQQGEEVPLDISSLSTR